MAGFMEINLKLICSIGLLKYLEFLIIRIIIIIVVIVVVCCMLASLFARLNI